MLIFIVKMRYMYNKLIVRKKYRCINLDPLNFISLEVLIK